MSRIDSAAGPFEVYVGAAPGDAHLAQALRTALRDRDLRVIVDADAPATASVITEHLTLGLSRSRVFVAIYSSDFSLHRRTQCIFAAAWLGAAEEVARRIIVLAPQDDTPELMPGDLKARGVDVLPVVDEPPSIDRVADLVAARVRAVSGELGRRGSLGPPPWHGTERRGNPRFVGRFETMWQIHAKVVGENREHATCVLVGPAGAGKTQLAEEFALRFGHAFPGGVFWVRAYGAMMTSEDRATERDRQIREIAAGLGVITANHSPAEIRAALHDALVRRKQQCLWIVDDLPADVPESDVHAFIGPASVASTIITTRSRRHMALGVALEVGGLVALESLHIVTVHGRPSASETDASAATSLLSDLGGHALSVALAAAAMRAEAYGSFVALREALATAGDKELEYAETLTDVVPMLFEPVIATLLVRTVKRPGREGRDLLRLASVLAFAPIRQDFFSSVMSKVDGLDTSGAEAYAEEAFAELEKYGLLEDEDPPGVVGGGTVHPLIVRTVATVDASAMRPEHLRAAAVSALTDKLPRKYDPTAYAAVQHEITHARMLVREADTVAETELLGRVARYDLVRGAYESGLRLYQRQREAYRRLFGEHHPDTVDALSNLAGAHFVSGDLDGARRLQEDVVAIRRVTPGAEHPDTLTAMANLAATRSIQGDLGGARDLQREILEVRARVQGTEHPKTTTAAWNLFLTLREMDDDGARGVFERHLRWLMRRPAAGLQGDQRRIRDAIAAAGEHVEAHEH